MMKNEWDALTGQTSTEAQWVVAHEVYQWHPLIQDKGGKQQLLGLWKVGGYGLLADMLPTANRAYELESHEEELNRAIEELEAEKCRVMQEFDERRRQIANTRTACRQAQRDLQRSFSK